jgi:hypothetical protein
MHAWNHDRPLSRQAISKRRPRRRKHPGAANQGTASLATEVAVFAVAHPQWVETAAAVVVPSQAPRSRRKRDQAHAWAAGGLQDAQARRHRRRHTERPQWEDPQAAAPGRAQGPRRRRLAPANPAAQPAHGSMPPPGRCTQPTTVPATSPEMRDLRTATCLTGAAVGRSESAVRTLMRYTGLSESTVRACLGRLEAAGLIRRATPPSWPRGSGEPTGGRGGWDLDLSLVRDDLAEEDVAALEGQFPGLAARLATRPSAGHHVHGVQSPHRVGAVDNAVDNPAAGVRPSHPVPTARCNQRTNGVHPVRHGVRWLHPNRTRDHPGSPPPPRARRRRRPMSLVARCCQLVPRICPSWPSALLATGR